MNRGQGAARRAPTRWCVFGATGDLAHKKIFPALYAMAKRGTLDVPVVGVASRSWSARAVAQARATASGNPAASTTGARFAACSRC